MGFVDLETDAYRLYTFVHPETAADTLALLQQISEVALRNCNVQFEIVSSNASANHPALNHLPRGIADPSPSAVLVSPDGQTLPLAFSRPGQPFQEGLASVLKEVASSPKREELLATVSRAFAAVLLVEGDVAEANERARQAISHAIDSIRGQMQSMPKAIAEPPAMVVLDAATLIRERILLWSLGLGTAKTAEPRAAVIYGRARWIGPLMKGAEISEPNLTGLLSIIGADCECGLDVAWTLGTRLPVRWDENIHARAAKALGFDPENPLVKVEVGRIARRSGSSRTTPAMNQAIVLSTDPSPMAGNPLSSGDREPGAASTPPERTAAEVDAPVGDASVLSLAWVSVAAMAIVVLSAGLFLFWKTGRRESK